LTLGTDLSDGAVWLQSISLHATGMWWAWLLASQSWLHLHCELVCLCLATTAFFFCTSWAAHEGNTYKDTDNFLCTSFSFRFGLLFNRS
jgi:hypothetical protein